MQSDRFSPIKRFPRAAIISSAILLFLLLAGATTHFWYRQRLLNEQRTALRADMALLANALSAGINRRLSVAEGLEAFVHADPEMALSQQMFQAFSAGLAASTAGTRTIALAPDGRISHVFPRAGNSDLLDQHLLDDTPPPLRQELQRAVQEGDSLVQAPVTIAGLTPGLTVQHPIFEAGELWGFVYLAYELQPLLQTAGLDSESQQGPLAAVDIALYDQHGALLYGQDALQNLQPLSSPVPFAAGSWQLLAVPAGGWAAAIRSPLLLFDAFLLTAVLLATAIAYTVTSRQVYLQEAVRQAAEASLRRREAELEEARLFRAVQRGAEQFRAISELGRQITTILDVDELLKQAVHLIRDTFGYYHVHIGLINGDTVELPATAGVYEDEETCTYCASLCLPLDELAICSRVAATGAPVVVDDIAQEPNYLHPHGATGSGAVVPIKVKGKVIGLLDVENHQTNAFDEQEVAVLQLLANQLAAAIENARLFKRERWQAEQFRTIADVSRQITAVRALDEVANQAAYLIQQAFGYYHVHIGLIEEDQVIFREATGVWRDERYCTYCSKHKFFVGQSGASGRVAATGEPLLVRDVRYDAYYVPMDEEQVGSALVLPLKVRHATIGVINIESDAPDAFDETDVSVLQPLANQLAIALENARLYEQASTLAALQERQKLARELHDSVSQALYGIGLGSRTALKLLQTEGTEKEALAPPLEYVLSMANAALAEMRALIFELRPESLATEGLIPALGRRVEVLRARDGLQVETTLDEEPDLPLNAKEVLYRVAQEALHNVVKHANASSVQISLSQQGDEVVLEICDNGVGFEPQAHFPGHLGLQSMRERVEGVGGGFQIESVRGSGTLVRVVLQNSILQLTAETR